ncbi:TetR family transcriptional regulator [Streptomyces sp. A0958]|uniref:ScbR family autoregulator-binding transcription factor n=1 Tax=Streptomyces sp. A0958 TaxID=2563101 RepID=UPI00109E48A0|nr:ScbR family autoregulator-binding transcription factor [Streptomyces sp. A0958]THA69997.1 TetR family transcriptional regulator [Streptomyces sp. A0958]
MAKQERALRTREALIKSAAEVFDCEGFGVASLTTISNRAGVSNGALHFHFASKAALAEAVEEAAGRRLDHVTRQATRGPNALQCLVNATHDLARGLREDVVLRAGFGLSSEQSYAGGQNLRLEWRRWVEGALKRADGEGVLTENLSAQDVMLAVVAATVGFEVLGARDATWLSYRTLTRFWQLLLPRLTPPAVLGALRAEGVHGPRSRSTAPRIGGQGSEP